MEKTVETSGSRGNIYDCNGILLAGNEIRYSLKTELKGMVELRGSKKTGGYYLIN